MVDRVLMAASPDGVLLPPIRILSGLIKSRIAVPLKDIDERLNSS
jgi:hypothetical protein